MTTTAHLAFIYGASRTPFGRFGGALADVRPDNLADAAWEAGFYDDLVAAVDGVDLSRDEGIRPGSSAENHAHRADRRADQCAPVRGRRRPPGG